MNSAVGRGRNAVAEIQKNMLIARAARRAIEKRNDFRFTIKDIPWSNA